MGPWTSRMPRQVKMLTRCSSSGPIWLGNSSLMCSTVFFFPLKFVIQTLTCLRSKGAELLLFVLTAHLMITSSRATTPGSNRSPPPTRRFILSRISRSLSCFCRDWKYFLYITVQFVLASIGIGSGCRTAILAFVENRNFPGGPIAWSNTYYNTKPSILGNTAFIVCIWLQDGFLVRVDF